MDVEETPVVGQVLHLGIAQRYSLLITARNDTSSNWGIHLNMNTAQFGQPALPGLKPSVTFHVKPFIDRGAHGCLRRYHRHAHL